MSLLHNAKKHFILAMVFVLTVNASAAALWGPGKAWAEQQKILEAQSQTTALAKALINSMAYCVSGIRSNSYGYIDTWGEEETIMDVYDKEFISDHYRQGAFGSGNAGDDWEIKNPDVIALSYRNEAGMSKDGDTCAEDGATIVADTFKALDKLYGKEGTFSKYKKDFYLKVIFDHKGNLEGDDLIYVLEGNTYEESEYDLYQYHNDNRAADLAQWVAQLYDMTILTKKDTNSPYRVSPYTPAEMYWLYFQGITWVAGGDAGVIEGKGGVYEFPCLAESGYSTTCHFNKIIHDDWFNDFNIVTIDEKFEKLDLGDPKDLTVGGSDYQKVGQWLVAAVDEVQQVKKEDRKAAIQEEKNKCKAAFDNWVYAYKWGGTITDKEGNSKKIEGIANGLNGAPEYTISEDKKEALKEFDDKIDYVKNLYGDMFYDGLDDKTLKFGSETVIIAGDDTQNRCFSELFEEKISKEYNDWATQKRQDNLKNACGTLLSDWITQLYELNGANNHEGAPGTATYKLTNESEAKRNEINSKVLNRVLGADSTKWNEVAYKGSGASTQVPHKTWEDFNQGQTPGTSPTGEYGLCFACEYINLMSQGLNAELGNISIPEVSGGCNNPKPSDVDGGSSGWVPPLIEAGDGYQDTSYKEPTFSTGETTSYENTVYEPDTCYEGSGSLGWILCPLIAGASNIGEGLWNQIETYHLKLPANALFGSIGSSGESGIHVAWRSIRDISNIVFVIVFLVIVISQVTGFGITNYGIKKMLPKLIVCIIIVNLSYILCQIAVDLSNTIGASITDFLRGIAGTIPWKIATVSNTGDGGLFSNGFITGALIAGGAGGLFALIASMRTGQNGAGAIIGGLGLFVLGIVIIILVAIITLYVTLMIREAAVVVCIAIAPLAIVCNVLPNTQPLFKKWLSLIKALLVLYPVSAFMVGGGQLAGAILASTGLNTMRLAAGVVQVLPYFFVPTLLRKSLAGLGNIGAKIGSLGKAYGRKASHGATGLIKNSRRYQDMLAGSKTNAANRYKTSEQARLERKKKRRERRGGQLSEPDVLRLQAAQEYNESRDAKIDAARRSIEADRAAARRRANSTEIATKDDKLMETYGGAQRDIYTGEMITNPDGSYVIDTNRANAYAEGVRLSSQVSTRKESEEKVAQAAHRQSLYLASARKSDIDLDNNLRTARAYSEDMDENGNFVPAGTGTYHASDYVNNQRRTQENKTNSALASGYVRPMETTFAGAHNQAQIRASEEIGKAAESEFREMDKAGPNGLATRMNTMARNIGARDANGNRTFASPGQLETLESSIKVASSRGLEKEAYASYNAALNSFGQAFAEAQASGNTTEMQEIQSRMDSFKRSMQSSPIKAISIHAKQTENMQIDSDMAASDANSYYQGAEFAGYADKKGGNLTIDKDSSAIFQRIGANFSAVHAMEQLGKNDLTQTQITDFAAMAERDLASNNTDISRALSARTLVNLPASTITTIASGTSDVNRSALMAAMNNISAQAMEKLTQEQVRALQTLNPNFGNNTSGNAGSNTGGNAGGNAGNNAGSDWGGSSDDDSGPFAI